MPGSTASDSCSFAGEDFFALPDFFDGAGGGLISCRGLKGWDWL